MSPDRQAAVYESTTTGAPDDRAGTYRRAFTVRRLTVSYRACGSSSARTNRPCTTPRSTRARGKGRALVGHGQADRRPRPQWVSHLLPQRLTSSHAGMTARSGMPREASSTRAMLRGCRSPGAPRFDTRRDDVRQPLARHMACRGGAAIAECAFGCVLPCPGELV